MDLSGAARGPPADLTGGATQKLPTANSRLPRRLIELSASAAPYAVPPPGGGVPWSEAPHCAAGKRAKRFLAASSVSVIRVDPTPQPAISPPGGCHPTASVLAATSSGASVRAETVFPPRGSGTPPSGGGAAHGGSVNMRTTYGRAFPYSFKAVVGFMRTARSPGTRLATTATTISNAPTDANVRGSRVLTP
jgi:hypothetical protein